MWQLRLTRPRTVALTALTLFLLAILACGGAAPPATESPSPTPPAAAAPTATPPPAGPAATPTAEPETAQPSGSRLTEKSLRMAITPLPQDTFLPWLATSSGHLPYRPMWENLTTIDPLTGVSEVLPQLATEWEISPDASTYTFHLRKGVPFHFDWGEFTVWDFINVVDQYVRADGITGCRTPVITFMGADSMTEMMEQGNLEVIDDHTFTMRLAIPQVDVADWWFNILQISCGDVWSKAQFEAEGDAMFESGPAGTGAYQFVDRVLKEFTEFERVPYDHWRVNPEFKTLKIITAPEDLTRLAMLLTGEADMVDIPKVLHDQAVNEGMEVLETPLPTAGLAIMMLGQYYSSQANYTPDQDPWAAPGETGRLVREAMNRAINREQIINVLFQGRGQLMYNNTFHSSLEGWNPRWEEEFEEKYGYDPELAKQLLDQAGFPGQGGQNRFSMEVYQTSLPGLPETIEVAQAVAQSFQDIGIDAKLVEVEFARAIDAFRDRHDAHFILPLRATIRPIMANMRIYWYSGPINPDVGIPTGGAVYAQEDPVYDRNYEALLGETDPAERNRLAREVGDMVYDNYGTIPIVYINNTIVSNPDVVEEYVFGSITGVFGHLEYAKAVQ